MNLSQQVRNTLAKSGDRMSVAEITDAMGGLVDRNFVSAICSQHAKSGVFGRAVEEGRLVYWMANSTAQHVDVDPVEQPAKESPKHVQAEAVASQAAPRKVEEIVSPLPEVVQAKEPEATSPPLAKSVTDKKQSALSNAIAELALTDTELQAERIQRTERTSHSIARMLTHLLSDAIDANLEHEVLRRISTAQMAVQDVHGYLVNLR